MRNVTSTWIMFVVSGVLAACGSTVVGGDAATDAARSPCPSAEPDGGASCAPAGLACEYGSDPRRECRDLARCGSTGWNIETPATRSPPPTWCGSVPTEMCPATVDAANGQTCTTIGAVCTYGGRLCECTNCVAFPVPRCGGNAFWSCDDHPAAGCPAMAPRFGDACAQNGLECEYGCNSPDGSVACMNGVWQEGSFRNCPISTRRAKRDVRYVTVAEADALAAQVGATRLATYEYTMPSMAGRRRLGFILEDQPASFASDPEHSRVDLYGYTSMLVAAVQSQHREIRALEERIAALEARGSEDTSARPLARCHR